MESCIAFRVTTTPEYKGVLPQFIVVHATSFIFEGHDTSFPVVSFQIETQEDEDSEIEYSTVMVIPLKAVLLIERITIECELSAYYSVSTNINPISLLRG